jgi:hypothetical protein
VRFVVAHRFSDRVEADAFVPTSTALPPEPGLYKKSEDVLGVHGVVDFDSEMRAGGVTIVGVADGWRDLVAPLSAAGVPTANAPTMTAFGSAHTPQREEFAFAVGDYVFCQPFHVNHDVKPGGAALVHVHWSTNGTSTATVKWELTIMRALGHDQANFGAPVVRTVTQAAAGTAWRHMVAEVPLNEALTLAEPDELILVTVKRVTNGGTDNADAVFGLTVDFHYEADRASTPNRAPNFYGA